MPNLCPVKFPYAARDLWFDAQDLEITRGDAVICETERGTEYGRAKGSTIYKDEEELESLIGESELKPVVRLATPEDDAYADTLADLGEAALPVFEELVSELELEMKPLAVEYLFGGERAVCYFVADSRVDFRQLARELAASFDMRVDMRQIGTREQASIMGGLAHCGQEYCCSRLSRGFGPVTIRMAKDQDLPLNSPKISGACGRLMCCLRYEDEAYRDFKSRAPKKNTLVETPLGVARVTEFDTPREAVGIRLEDNRSLKIPLSSMECSPEAQERAKIHDTLCRPDCVSLKALKALNSPQVQLALAQLDAENELGEGEWAPEEDVPEVEDPKAKKLQAPKRLKTHKGEPKEEDLQPGRARRRRHVREGAKRPSSAQSEPKISGAKSQKAKAQESKDSSVKAEKTKSQEPKAQESKIQGSKTQSGSQTAPFAKRRKGSARSAFAASSFARADGAAETEKEPLGYQPSHRRHHSQREELTPYQRRWRGAAVKKSAFPKRGGAMRYVSQGNANEGSSSSGSWGTQAAKKSNAHPATTAQPAPEGETNAKGAGEKGTGSKEASARPTDSKETSQKRAGAKGRGQKKTRTRGAASKDARSNGPAQKKAQPSTLDAKDAASAPSSEALPTAKPAATESAASAPTKDRSRKPRSRTQSASKSAPTKGQAQKSRRRQSGPSTSQSGRPTNPQHAKRSASQRQAASQKRQRAARQDAAASQKPQDKRPGRARRSSRASAAGSGADSARSRQRSSPSARARRLDSSDRPTSGGSKGE